MMLCFNHGRRKEQEKSKDHSELAATSIEEPPGERVNRENC